MSIIEADIIMTVVEVAEYLQLEKLQCARSRRIDKTLLKKGGDAKTAY